MSEETEPILVCVAWPYANGPLHLGHVAGCYLPADIFARYQRAIGNDILMVSGSDQHGTPITVTADREGVTPDVIADRYHEMNARSLEKLGISFDLFWYTSHPNHKKRVQDLFMELHENGYVYRESIEAAYCPSCERYLPDRYIEGGCPHCGSESARGDQCDQCGRTLDPDELGNAHCKLCGNAPETRTTEHFFLRLSAFEKRLEQWLEDKDHWRANTINFTRNWLREGLKDRAITRDIGWGIEIPIEGYEDKRIYVWFEAVSGYFTTTVEWSERHDRPEKWKEFWHNPEAKHYYFLAKDNIPFHTIIWPAILMGHGGLTLPYDVPANEYLLLKGAQFSKSRRHAVWVPAYLEQYEPDALRYYLSINMPETHDTDFTWKDFVRRTNDELVATYGNLVHRVLTFTAKHFGAVPPARPADRDGADEALLDAIEGAFAETSEAIAQCRFKRAIKRVMELAHTGNRYFDRKAPWAVIKEDRAQCGSILRICLRLVKALAMLTYPFMPFAAQTLWTYIGQSGPIEAAAWSEGREDLITGTTLSRPKPLFKKLDLEEVLAHEAAMAESEEPEEAEELTTVPDELSETALEPTDFQTLDVRIGTIEDIEIHPNADTLYILSVNDGGTRPRQLVAGLRPYYKTEELLGRTIAVLSNLAPAKLRGVRSEGMLLAADDESDDETVAVLRPASDTDPGMTLVAYGATGDTPEAVPGEIAIDDFMAIDLRIGEMIGSLPMGETVYALFDIGEDHPALAPVETEKQRSGMLHRQYALVVTPPIKKQLAAHAHGPDEGPMAGFESYLIGTDAGVFFQPNQPVENGSKIR